jgi:hypothetical protein
VSSKDGEGPWKDGSSGPRQAFGGVQKCENLLAAEVNEVPSLFFWNIFAALLFQETLQAALCSMGQSPACFTSAPFICILQSNGKESSAKVIAGCLHSINAARLELAFLQI